jgi:hypothetical protein
MNTLVSICSLVSSSSVSIPSLFEMIVRMAPSQESVG